jgi:hypothetical protein
MEALARLVNRRLQRRRASRLAIRRTGNSTSAPSVSWRRAGRGTSRTTPTPSPRRRGDHRLSPPRSTAGLDIRAFSRSSAEPPPYGSDLATGSGERHPLLVGLQLRSSARSAEVFRDEASPSRAGSGRRVAAPSSTSGRMASTDSRRSADGGGIANSGWRRASPGCAGC